MKRSMLLQTAVLLVAGCSVGSGRTLLPVEQAAIQSQALSVEETVDFIEPILSAHGFKPQGGIRLSSTRDVDFDRNYEGLRGSTASITVESGCVSLVTWVEEGNYEYIAPRAAFNDVLSQLRQRGSWQIDQGGGCLLAR